MEISFKDIEHLKLSDEVSSLLLYFVNELGLSIDEGLPIAQNWSRTELQTPDEVRSGVLHERWLRENFHSDGTPIIRMNEDPEK